MPCFDENAGRAQACREKGPVAASSTGPYDPLRIRLRSLGFLFRWRACLFRRCGRLLRLRSGLTCLWRALFWGTLLRRAFPSLGRRSRFVLSPRFIRGTGVLCAWGGFGRMACRRPRRTLPSLRRRSWFVLSPRLIRGTGVLCAWGRFGRMAFGGTRRTLPSLRRRSRFVLSPRFGRWARVLARGRFG